MTFFFAGMDTTGFTSGMCFYLLAKYPEEMKII
jgi:cytochrome P450